MNNINLDETIQNNIFQEFLQKLIQSFPIQKLEKKYLELILGNVELFHTFLLSTPEMQQLLLDSIDSNVLNEYMSEEYLPFYFNTLNSWINNNTVSDKEMITILQPLIFKLNQPIKHQFLKKLVTISPIFISPSQGLISVTDEELIDFIQQGIYVEISRWKKHDSNLVIIKNIIDKGHIKDFKSINPVVIFNNPKFFQSILKSPNLYDEFLDVVETSLLPKENLSFIINFYIDNLKKYPLTLKRIKFFKYHISHQEHSAELFKKLKKNVILCLKKNSKIITNSNHIFSTYFLMESDDEKLFLLEKILNCNNANTPLHKIYLSNVQIVLQNILKDKTFEKDFLSLPGYLDFLEFNKILGTNPIQFVMYATKKDENERKQLEQKTHEFLNSCLQTLQYFYLNNHLVFSKEISDSLRKKIQKI